MKEELKRVALVPAQGDAKPTVLMLDEGQLNNLTTNMNYGCGWFRYTDGPDTTWFNLREYRCVCIQ